MRYVADASSLVELLADASSDLAEILDPRGRTIAVPAVCDAEFVGAIARQLRLGKLDPDQANDALIDYVSFPLEHHHHLSHVGRMWQLRDNFTAADATYVALAESLEATLVTVDHRLATATRAHTSVPVLP